MMPCIFHKDSPYPSSHFPGSSLGTKFSVGKKGRKEGKNREKGGREGEKERKSKALSNYQNK